MSSSEDLSDMVLLKGTVGVEFLSDNMYKKHDGKKKSNQDGSTLKSLRPDKDTRNEQFSQFNESLGFQNYVAKHLEKILDDSLGKNMKPSEESIEKKKWKNGGVKLFTNSSRFVKCSCENDSSVSQKRVLKHRNTDTDDEDKLKSVVIEPDVILSKVETKMWSKRTKALVYHYKRARDGKLLLME